jgi:hypothetical protein
MKGVRSQSPGARRMRLLRLRRRDGVACCVTVEVFRYEIDKMIRQGLLQPGQVRDRGAVTDAVGQIVERWSAAGDEAAG